MSSPAQVHHTVNTIQVLVTQIGLCAILVEEGLASTSEVTPHLAHFLHRLETTSLICEYYFAAFFCLQKKAVKAVRLATVPYSLRSALANKTRAKKQKCSFPRFAFIKQENNRIPHHSGRLERQHNPRPISDPLSPYFCLTSRANA